MRRFTTVLALAIACSFGVSAAYAGPGCCASKKKSKLTKVAKSSCSTKSSCSSKDEFPKLVRMIGDKTVECPYTAEKMAKESGSNVKFVVAGETYECEKSAMSAYADSAEKFVDQFTTIACVVDGKVMYCGDESAEAKGCSAKTAKAAGCSASKTKLAKAESKGSCASKTKLAKAESKGCCASKTKLAKAESKGCSASKTKLAKAESKGCSASKTKLAKAEGCCKSSTCASKAKLAKGEVKTCPLSGKTITADDDKDTAKAKLVKAGGQGCCASKAKVAKAEGKGCCKSASKTKLAKAGDEGKTCPFSGRKIKSVDDKDADKAKFVIADKSKNKACCKADKFRVIGREFAKWDDAVKARDDAIASIKKVKMSYLVDGTPVDCCSKVCPKAKEAGKVKFVVGENKMDCEYKARVALSKAKYAAARNAGNKSLAKS
ncbi:MAG: hypothetical protein MI923_13910 [Phycisphaerales bacterium]|nr:hypothetical protein [Phycisphaerales bacterium]